jgi:hypothetical protein
LRRLLVQNAFLGEPSLAPKVESEPKLQVVA